MTVLIVLSFATGFGLLVAGLVVYWKWPGARRAAFGCWALAVVLQLWWLVLGALALYKFVVLRQDT